MKNELIAIRKQLAKILFNFSEEVSAEGTTLIWDGEVVVGTPMFTYDDMGEKIVVPDGTYTLSDMSIVTVGGVVTAVTPVAPETPAPEITIETENAPNDFAVEFEEINAKITALADAVNKINEVVMAFGQETVEPPKKVNVEDHKAVTAKASKYFQK